MLLLRRGLWQGNRDESRIDVLANADLEALGAEVYLKDLKKLLDNFGLEQSLTEEGGCGGIWNAVNNTKPDKLLKGASVIHLEFKIFIAEGEKLLENEHLDRDQRVNPLEPCIALALVLIALVKQWAE